jgi:hypothetical protein
MQTNKTTTTHVTKMGTGLLTAMLFLFTLGMLSHTVSDSDSNSTLAQTHSTSTHWMGQ